MRQERLSLQPSLAVGLQVHRGVHLKVTFYAAAHDWWFGTRRLRFIEGILSCRLTNA